MAETALATAYVKIVPSFKGFKEAFDQYMPDMDKSGKSSGEKFGKSFGGGLSSGIKTAFALVATGTVANFTKDLISAGEAEVASNKKLENIAKSMGVFGDSTAAVTKRLEDLSAQQQMQLGIDDDVIKSTQMKLLTFKNLAITAGKAGGMFDRATLAAQDLAAAGFGTAETNAVQLGKALQDPIKGITALARSGVTFTEQEKKKIEQLVKSNKLLDAQEIIMKSIETQVGGTAAAGATGSMKMEQAFNQLKETLGTALLPTFNSIADFITTTLIPKVQDFFQRFKEGKTELNPVIDGIKGFIQFVIDNKDWLGPIIASVTTLIGLLKIWNTWTKIVTAAQLLLDAALDANPIGAIILAVAALTAALIWFFTKTKTGRDLFALLKKDWSFAINGMKYVVQEFGNHFINIINGCIDAVNLLLSGIKLLTFGTVDLKIPKIPLISWSSGPPPSAFTSTPSTTGTPPTTTTGYKGIGPTPPTAGTTFIYNAAPNNSLTSEGELISALVKARIKGVGN